MIITDEINEFFYPQSRVLKRFNIPEELYKYEVEDFRHCYWFIDSEQDRILLRDNFNNNTNMHNFYIKPIYGIINNKRYYADIFVAMLIGVSSKHTVGFRTDVFIIFDGNKELVYEHGKYHIKEQKQEFV